MQDFSLLFNTMIVFLALMTIGYVGARMKVLTKEFSKAANKLVMNVFLSASVLNSVLGEQPELSGGQLWHVMLMMSLTMLLCYVVGAAAGRIFRLGGDDRAVMEMLMNVPNTMFVGLPIVQELFGPTAVLYLALSCIPFNVLLYSYGVWRFTCDKGGGGKFSLKTLFNIPFIATLVSLVVFFFHIPIPAVGTKLIGTLAATTMPMSMIVIGATLGSVNLLDAFREKRVYIVSFFRLLVAPVLAWLMLSLLTNDPILLATGVIIAGCPSGVIVTVLSLEYDHNAVFSSKGVLAATSLCMLTLPLVISVLL